MSKLLKRAKVKLHNAKMDYHMISADDAYLDDCCYNLQQAIEMTLKFLVEIHGETYITNITSHDIRAQVNKLSEIGVDIPYYTEISNMSVTLNSWETESRYKDSFFAIMDDVDNAIKYAEELIQFADSIVIENDSGAEEITAF